jgi:quinol monooxygenase YgiN
MAMHIFVHFEAQPGREQQLRDELMLILKPTRAEAGCAGIQLYETLRQPLAFMIHSEWIDEAAFDAHAQLPHMKRFLGLVSELAKEPPKAIGTKQIG